MPDKERNQVMLIINKCPECPAQDCPHRQLCGFIPDECPKLAENKTFISAMKELSRIDAVCEIIKDSFNKRVGERTFHVSKDFDINDAIVYFGEQYGKQFKVSGLNIGEFGEDEPLPKNWRNILSKIRARHGKLWTMTSHKRDARTALDLEHQSRSYRRDK
ncbi:MAG TPA: hypothetical protein PL124_03010 [Candidatus Cloacimonadota bacterium]|nr:hypothetical protein [Candidatus Cloacimonadota bacterium]HPS38362.1 hypothetical protein [Candidatus Cloacimonadota bacterium]